MQRRETRRQQEKRRRRQWRRRALLGGIATLAVVAAFATLFGLTREDGPSGPPRAAIIDQVSLTYPNPDFIEKATRTLKESGHTVDYYPGDEVTVDLYRRLPSLGYDVILFRVHADRIEGTWRGEPIDEVILFSSEPYDPRKYRDDLSNKRLTSARYYEGGERFFGISPDFIDDRMTGDFGGATIFMMGCEGLISERTAQAFIDKGADTYISWDETVSASHTDAATERLLDLMLLEGQSAQEAVAQTMAEIGPDPTYGSKLGVYEP